MIKKFIAITLVIITVHLVFIRPANSNVIIHMEVQQGAQAAQIVNIKLFNELTPATVSNFLKYVNNGNYNNSFFHRNATKTVDNTVTDFIIQGGAFTFDPLLNDGTFTLGAGGIQEIPAYPAISNEFAKSNTLGTIAMEKLSGNPDSATNQWLINLADNASILDNQNGGFTVFGEIISNGMNIINLMAAVPVFNKSAIHPAFSELPLESYTTGAIIKDNLVTITAINERFSVTSVYNMAGAVVGDTLEPEDVDFGIITVGNVVTATVTIKNRHVDTLTIGGIANIDLLSVPYMITSESCTNVSLIQNASCVISISFTPVSESKFDDTLNIEFTSINLSYTLNIHGESSLTPPPASNIVLSKSSIVFDEIELYDFTTNLPPEVISVQIANKGTLDLNISSFDITGEFRYTENCIKSPIKPGDDCVLNIGFFPESIGEKAVTVIVNSDDPDNGVLIIPITGSASIDNDRVLTIIEDLAPNNGDGNYDNVKDSEQSNVLSIDTNNNRYMTMVMAEALSVSNFTVVDYENLISPPENIQTVFDYKLNNLPIVPPGEPNVVDVGLFLHPGNVPSTFYIYGPTRSNTNPHWYEFGWDGFTGAQIYGDVIYETPQGVKVNKSLVKVVFIDGARGDSDLSVNGRISVNGALTTGNTNTESDSSGSLVLMTIIYLLSFLVFFRKWQAPSSVDTS